MVKTSLKAIIMIGITIITWLSITSIDSNAVNAIAQQHSTDFLKNCTGGGNATGPLTVFSPKNMEIKAGQSVTWSNPTTVGEPHTVTFVLDNTTFAGVVSPLSISNTTKFMSLPPGSNNAPILLPGENGTNTIIAINARTFNPVVIDSTGNTKFMNPNASYSMNGTESMLIPVGFYH